MADEITKEHPSEDHTLIRPEEELMGGAKKKRQYPPPYAVVVDGPRIGLRFPLQEGMNFIGRAIGAAIRLDDQSVSRNHAELQKGASGWRVKDLGSKNGTLVNGKLIETEVMLGHKDLIKIGVYILRLITQETPLDEEMTLPPEYVMADRTLLAKVPLEGEKEEAKKKETKEEDVALRKKKRRFPFSFLFTLSPKFRRLLLLGSGGIVIILLGGSLLQNYLFRAAPDGSISPEEFSSEVPEDVLPLELPVDAPVPPMPDPMAPLPETQVPVEAPPGASLPEEAAQPVQPVDMEGKIPIFLDLASSPLPAEVTFQGKGLGKTPLRVNLELEPDLSYTVISRFEMPEVNEEFSQQQEFTVEIDKSVVPILFRGPIGMIRADNLPRDVQFYLEGNFEYDRFRARSAKLEEIVLRKPIYIPYGRYVLELKRARKLSETSETFVQDIIYHRDFQLAKENPTYVINVREEDLNVFPVEIRSDPLNADVFIDGKIVGKTPYKGGFPLGEHQMSLRKEGYFEHTEALKVDINTPYATEVTLRTSIAGGHLNNARAALTRNMYQEAINELAEALASSPASSEEALANLLLGQAYLRSNDPSRALGYFEKAKNYPGQKYAAMVGIVNVYAIEGKTSQALPLLVEVMLKNQDEEIKRQANDLFEKISPFRSMVYVYSEPLGATVTVNGKQVEQLTPVILHELPLGTYRVKIEKAGYLPTDLNLNLTVNEFNPVVVKLKEVPK